jgi:hypothetical protein
MRAVVVGLIGTLILCSTRPAYAQVASVGKGWLLPAGGSITSAPGEVISGKNSIKITGSTNGTFVFPLLTDPTIVRFVASRSYTMTWSYRIITASAGGFSYGFASSEGERVLDFGPGALLRGEAGASGTASATFTLHNYGDYRVQFAIDGIGSIVIDDIRITDANGQLVASENAEGPSLATGPLPFQVTDALSQFTPAQGSAMAVAPRDLDGDGYPDILLTLYGLPSCGVPMQPIVIESSARIRIATSEFFPAGIPVNNCTPMIQFADIDGDGRTDIVFADAGLDAPPFTGNRIGIALNNGDGTYRDVTSLIPASQRTTRSYAVVAGDVDGDGRVEIILPDAGQGANTALLRWNGNGFDEIRNWIPQSIWTDPPAYLNAQSWMNLADFDRDGRLDLLVTGQDHNPNFQIVFGGPGGFTAGTLVVLPDGPFGHTQGGPQPAGTLTTGEVSPVAIADFNNDGLPDIFAINRNITLIPNVFFTYGESTYLMRLNQGSRQFADASPSPWVNLGRVEYQNLMTADMNNDGFIDVVGTYQADGSIGVSPQWGTTLFLNDGTGAFQVVDGREFVGATTSPPDGKRWNLGSFVPTVISPRRTEGVVYESVGGCGTPGGCPAVRLNLFKVVANAALGTGPNFVDPETLGAPGFNEFYYLRHYADAAAAVAAGHYKTGLEHYLAVGAARGYRSHAVICASCPLPFGSVDTPLDGAANLSGSIAISGWALSASGVTAVRILRAPIAGEGSQPVLLGTAVRVAGARPDVTAAYPTHLGRERAGWGYLLLTNMLPNGGNGSYTLYVYADDADGRSTLIGTRTITVDNAAATRPFGGIDTPGQGEIVSGTYVNFGWVLTPKPKLIPKDGSTITVYVDGVPLGHPTYDQYRADIATLFPGLENTHGAVGAFVIDTTKVANGVHTISWLVTDSAGVSEGIGSRFFTVQNPR